MPAPVMAAAKENAWNGLKHPRTRTLVNNDIIICIVYPRSLVHYYISSHYIKIGKDFLDTHTVTELSTSGIHRSISAMYRITKLEKRNPGHL